MAECKFCKKDKMLIRAHIIPQAIIARQVKQYCCKNLIQIGRDREKPKPIKANGYFDKDILCSECDGQFGKYEEKLINFLHDSKNDYNYRNISLAIKGILWKAHITNHQEFQNINLGKYSKVLYESLSNCFNIAVSIPPQDFLIWIKRYKNTSTIISTQDILANMINCGIHCRDDYYGRLYRFDFWGYQILIRVGGELLPKSFNRFLTYDQHNISEITYSFTGSKNDIESSNRSILNVFQEVTIN